MMWTERMGLAGLAARLLLSAVLLALLWVLYLGPIEICPPRGESSFFPCDPLRDRLDAALYLAYSGGMTWLLLIAAAPTAPLRDLAACGARIALVVLALLAAARLPDFVLEGADSSRQAQETRDLVFLITPMALVLAAPFLLRWPWLWRPDREARLTRGQKLRLAVLFPMLAVFLTQCMTGVNLNPTFP